jgi:hypothetical protein
MITSFRHRHTSTARIYVFYAVPAQPFNHPALDRQK